MTPDDRASLQPHEKVTLEIGSFVVLTMLGLGLQVGDWSAWSAVPVIGGYLFWVVVYSEVSVRVLSAATRQTCPWSLPG